MGFHRDLADAQFVGDQLVGLARSYKFQNCNLPPRQLAAILLLVPPCPRAQSRRVDFRLETLRQVNTAAHHHAQRLGDFFPCRRFGNEAGSTTGNGLPHRLRIADGGKNDDRRVRQPRPHADQVRQALRSGHEQVQHHQIERVVRIDHREQILDRSGLDSFERRAVSAENLAQHAAQGVAKQRMILGDQHTRHDTGSSISASAPKCCAAAWLCLLSRRLDNQVWRENATNG